MCKNVIQFALL